MRIEPDGGEKLTLVLAAWSLLRTSLNCYASRDVTDPGIPPTSAANWCNAIGAECVVSARVNSFLTSQIFTGPTLSAVE